MRVGGIVGLIGILTGVAGQASPTTIMRKSITVRGIYVGSRAMFADMNRAIELHGIKPVIDQRFAFEDAKAANHTMLRAGHFGKHVIEMCGRPLNGLRSHQFVFVGAAGSEQQTGQLTSSMTAATGGAKSPARGLGWVF